MTRIFFLQIKYNQTCFAAVLIFTVRVSFFFFSFFFGGGVNFWSRDLLGGLFEALVIFLGFDFLLPLF